MTGLGNSIMLTVLNSLTVISNIKNSEKGNSNEQNI